MTAQLCAFGILLQMFTAHCVFRVETLGLFLVNLDAQTQESMGLGTYN